MSASEDFLRFPTLEHARIAPIESPSTVELLSLYGDLILEILGIDAPIDNLMRNAASKVLNLSFLENPEAEEGSELWLTGAKAMFTQDRTMIREVAENDSGYRVPDDELPDVIGFPLRGTESIQGFFSTFSIGPVIDVGTEHGDYLDFSFCVKVDNPSIRLPLTPPDRLPEFHVGNWLVVLGNEPIIGLVSK